jgi:hypothetical protein
MRRLALLAPFLSLLVAREASAQYRLRADAVGYSSAPQSPVGLLVLQGEDKAQPWIDTEALVWAGTGAGNPGWSGTAYGSGFGNADALSLMVRLHDPRNYGELRLGRQFITAGALRPLHLDGGDARLRLPWGTSFEAFGGVPVQPRLGYGAYDWATGARVGQLIGRDTTIGVSYLQQRQYGALAYEEAGFDFASSPARWFDVSTHGAYDLIDPGLAEAGISVAGRFDTVRPELFALHRSPSRLLPATSLFSALGDTPSDTAGASLLWRMFPRLDLLPVASARSTDGDLGLDATLRVVLRLDDKGAVALSLEGRRQGAGPDTWTGVRASARVPINLHLRWSTELELVAPDDPRGRGTLWPWGLVAMTWMPADRWEVAGAVESASTPTSRFELNGIVRLSRSWGGP